MCPYYLNVFFFFRNAKSDSKFYLYISFVSLIKFLILFILQLYESKFQFKDENVSITFFIQKWREQYKFEI